MNLSPDLLKLLGDPTITLIALAAATGGGLFAAIVATWQSVLSTRALRAQVRANELQAFTTMNLKFLDIIAAFQDHINDPVEQDVLTSDEKRAIDRYFYLANMEFILYKEKVINEKLSAQWIQGIASAAKRKPFADRWNSRASKFTFDPDFRAFVVRSMGEAKA